MAEGPPDAPAATKTRLTEKQVTMQKIYIKDLSFESPQAPAVFMSNVAPRTELSIRSDAHEIAANTHEVTLTVTATAKSESSTLFVAEVVQAAVFVIQGYSDQERAILAGSVCPGALYPFAREAIANVIGKGGFPPLLLHPINFDALYEQTERKREQARAATAGEPS